ncbi:hypothetical protein J6590_004127 [Homalodisca vitripennis]|nr:hypothetical protein J6590_004127 [Homalodisca vitripennis]
MHLHSQTSYRGTTSGLPSSIDARDKFVPRWQEAITGQNSISVEVQRATGAACAPPSIVTNLFHRVRVESSFKVGHSLEYISLGIRDCQRPSDNDLMLVIWPVSVRNGFDWQGDPSIQVCRGSCIPCYSDLSLFIILTMILWSIQGH